MAGQLEITKKFRAKSGWILPGGGSLKNIDPGLVLVFLAAGLVVGLELFHSPACRCPL